MTHSSPRWSLLHRLMFPAGLTLAIVAGDAAAQPASPPAPQPAAQPPLTLQVYNAGPASFHVNAVLVSGRSDAVLLDTGFTRADALRIAAMVLDSGKTLKTIYISQADPDFYFGAQVLTQVFPQAQLVASAPTVAKIHSSLATKLQVWGPRLGANAPVSVPVPKVMAGDTLTLDDQVLQVRGLQDGLAHRSFVWIPSIRTIAGGTNVFAGLHAWTADTQTAKERTEWNDKLGTMAALQPLVVVPGHMLPGQRQDASQIAYTQGYLTRFEAELQQAANAAALIDVMKAAYPAAGLGIALDIGAKVNKGEMKW